MRTQPSGGRGWAAAPERRTELAARQLLLPRRASGPSGAAEGPGRDRWRIRGEGA